MALPLISIVWLYIDLKCLFVNVLSNSFLFLSRVNSANEVLGAREALVQIISYQRFGFETFIDQAYIIIFLELLSHRQNGNNNVYGAWVSFGQFFLFPSETEILFLKCSSFASQLGLISDIAIVIYNLNIIMTSTGWPFSFSKRKM